MPTDLITIESTLRAVAARIRAYRRVHDPDSDELDALTDAIGEQADQVRIVAQPLTVRRPRRRRHD